MKHGDFTALAENYAQYRPGYAPMIADIFVRLSGEAHPRCLDAGAGTGIWSRQLAAAGAVVEAVEPNDAMRQAGERQSDAPAIRWHKGTAEATGLESGSCRLACMASSFHWPDFAAAVREFHRILMPGGYFMALWNTRFFESNPLLAEIEAYLRHLAPEMKRVSSGRSEFCNSLRERLAARPEFADVVYLEGRHVEYQSPQRYLGLWESVNDVRVQLGEAKFARFLAMIRERTAGLERIEAEYLTRAWIARRAD
ncbi:class I SAM-dependent methyltransferase [uncultured Desulfovibrio sp.]|uniref:Class I SAM-dependent methyltransferase n=1 Tax=Candidatus Desulfovibrio intestinavium TaxID=2838534 RepID=A0A9D2KRS7_9BACT|nr:class I SAM-dependent methyltransferase [uncultured Desulfovibrio sp.]HJA79200.1 class I SAM-dependent methyltransferase [Candidatus Desulfovibrio intestinavium]